MRIAVVDPGIRQLFHETLRARVPAEWQVSTESAGAAALVTENASIGPEQLRRAGDGVRLIVKLDSGSADLDVGDVPTLEVPNTALVGVAEHTVALILATSRQLVAVDRRTRARAYLADRAEPRLTNQKDYTYNWIGLEDFGTIYRRTVGLVGLGYIGRAVAARLRPFGVKLRYTQRNRLSEDVEKALGVEYRDLDALLEESDVVSLHHRFDDGSHGNDGQFGAAEFGRMRPGTIFVNTARGRLVDENALAEALTTGHLMAALDVFRYEPLPADHPFLRIPSPPLLLTPHVGGGPVDEAFRHMSDEIIERLNHIHEENRNG
jgi:phosphoglycerate dehydrogenase-like enzyme